MISFQVSLFHWHDTTVSLDTLLFLYLKNELQVQLLVTKADDNTMSFEKRDPQIKLFKLDNARSGQPVSLARGSCVMRWSILGRIGILKCWFSRGGENRNTRGKTSRSRERTNNKLSPHMARAHIRTRATWVGGECSHHCASPPIWWICGLIQKVKSGIRGICTTK